MGKLEFLANTWEVVFDKDCSLHVDTQGKRWKLKQYHLHNAEHAVNGLYYPLEVHMVHQTEQNETLVVGLFIVSSCFPPPPVLPLLLACFYLSMTLVLHS